MAGRAFACYIEQSAPLVGTLQRFLARGGELVSTWSEDRWLHAEIPPISLNGGKKTSDEANFALAA
jgi:hypothetical protein